MKGGISLAISARTIARAARQVSMVARKLFSTHRRHVRAWLAEQRRQTKTDACSAVTGYMNALHVTLEDMLEDFVKQHLNSEP